jgi:hypothetical protein
VEPAHRLRLVTILLVSTLARTAVHAQRASDPPAKRAVYVDRTGVIRWSDSKQEVALFGANYTLPSASDYRAAGYLERDRKRLIDEDMAHFARMGWDALRLASWGDWESADRAGNLIANEHQDLLDYLIARARERGIYMLLTPIQTYDAGWPDALDDTTYPGFSRHFPRTELGTRAEAIAAQTNYLKQLLNHVNPYTGVALKDEPSILFIEMINEPVHHPADQTGSVKYINALVDAVRGTGAKQILFHNVSQDFAIGTAIRMSRAQGITFGWYPTGLNSGHELQGNYLRTVDAYDNMRRPELAGLPRIVYEFDSPDLRTGYMYPAMVRTLRSVGAQFATMFAYDMLATASRNLGWQTHYLNLVYTPRKAMSAVIAAEAMRRLPRGQSYGAYPQNTRFGDFRVSYEENLSELVTPQAFLYAGTTRTTPPDPKRLMRIAGYGSSPVVSYGGYGVYFLDKVRDGVWRLEAYPDAMPVNDPFEMQSAEKVVTRAVFRSWPMEVRLPDLGPSFRIEAITQGNTAPLQAEGGRFDVTPGVYVLSARGPVDRKTLPSFLGYLRFDEYHAPAPDSLPLRLELSASREYVNDRPVEIGASIVDATPPDSVTLSVRPAGAGFFRRFATRSAGGYDYRVSVPADSLAEGAYEYAITVVRGGETTTFPEGLHKRPWDWDYYGTKFWTATVVRPTTPLRLFTPAEDVRRLAFTRIGDAGRSGLFRVIPSQITGAPVFHLALPVFDGRGVEDYTASLVVKERIAPRMHDIARAKALRVRLRGLSARQTLHLTLVEDDGTSWSAAIPVDSVWSERTVPLTEFALARGVKLPEGFPGEWNYWMGPAAGRGDRGDAIRMPHVERLQLSLRKADATQPAPDAYGVEIESVTLVFE